MDKIEKTLAKLTAKERERVKHVLEQLKRRNVQGLNIKKLKGSDDIYRVRKGDIRIIYRTDDDGGIFLLGIQRRREDTYRLKD